MEHKMAFGIGVVLCSNIIASISQIMLKHASKKSYVIWWKAYVNPLVITAYLLFGVTTLLSVLALHYIPLSVGVAFGASGQIFVPVFSYFLLHEKISKKQSFGMLIIIVGILVFSL